MENKLVKLIGAIGAVTAVAGAVYVLKKKCKKKYIGDVTEIEISEDDSSEEKTECCEDSCSCNERDVFKPSYFTSAEQAKAYDELLTRFKGNTKALHDFIISLYDNMCYVNYVRILRGFKASEMRSKQ